ncbi:AMP-binding protein [Rhodobacter sp. SY28-1]|uniref:AMP-binding protein n=1 Tax=Rhodobacter sp. SY28-1 TaxID=2562317 RepID=UPI0010BFD6D8|nr:AMP-binding protein [Rhodobacter sp. SY28-1]
MTDSFRWHPKARLFDSSGTLVPPVPQSGAVLPDTPAGLAAAIGHPAFRIGAADQPAPDPEGRPVFETLTSGSTGRPRRIRRTQASWTASFAVNAGFGIGPGARVAVLGRLAHSLSLYGAVEGVHLGAEVHLLDALRPDRQAVALGRRGVTHLYATPAQLRLLAAAQDPCPDLQFVFVGGSKLDATLCNALAALAPNAQVREFYGAAETSFITLADAETPDASVGRAYPGVEITVDPGDEVWVRSTYLFLGYGDQSVLGAGQEGQGPGGTRWRDGWLSVGEIGSLQSGYLYLKGRAGRMVTVADQNVFPEEIEALLQALPGVSRAAVLPVKDALRGHALVAVLQGDAGQEDAILGSLRGTLGPTKAPKALIWRDDWPVLASGKTDLKALEASLSWPG